MQLHLQQPNQAAQPLADTSSSLSDAAQNSSVQPTVADSTGTGSSSQSVSTLAALQAQLRQMESKTASADSSAHSNASEISSDEKGKIDLSDMGLKAHHGKDTFNGLNANTLLQQAVNMNADSSASGSGMQDSSSAFFQQMAAHLQESSLVEATKGSSDAQTSSFELPKGVGSLEGLSGMTSATPSTSVSLGTDKASGTDAMSAGYNIDTPVDSPEFPGALAHQVSYLMKDGVQEAQLNLNPVDMGPIQVHIELNGQHAQVDFAATSSATRQILEGSMADLATSMQSAGFTLSGGGVSQQFRSGQQGSGQQSESSKQGQQVAGINQEDTAPVTRRPASNSSLSGLDLYA